MWKETKGEVISISKQWWLKINTKSFRKDYLDGALFPHIIKVKYIVNDIEYTKKKWISPYKNVPLIGENVIVIYRIDKPKKAKIIL